MTGTAGHSRIISAEYYNTGKASQEWTFVGRKLFLTAALENAKRADLLSIPFKLVTLQYLPILSVPQHLWG